MTSATPRLMTLDGLRGLAVMGIVLMNIAAFALPEAAYFNPLAFGPAGPAEIALWAVQFVLVDGKMRGLFSLLFGASLLLVLDRARNAGGDADRAHFRRMGWLLLFGLVHFFLIWRGDILTLYAAIGCVAWFFSEASTRRLIGWGAIMLAVALLAYGRLVLLMLPSGAGDAAAWATLQNAYGVPDAASVAREIAIYRGDYGGIVRHHVGDLGWLPLAQILLVGPETLALMLFGMAALRGGFLTGGWSRAAYVRAALLGYGLGLPLSLLLAWACWRSGFDARMMLAAALPLGLLPRLFMLIGHAALAMLWLTGGGGPLRRRVAAVGRAAFSNYLGSSLLMAGLFYGYGLGLFGRLDRFALLGTVIAAWALMLWWSRPWLDRFAYGPLEWLWRSLARGERQSFRKQDIARHSH